MNLPISTDSEILSERRRLQAKARRLAKRVETLAGAGRVDEAIVCQSEVAALRPHDAGAFLRLGLLLRSVHQIEPAVNAFRQALTIDPAERDPREALIATLLDGGRFKEIIAESKALVRVAPRSVFARDILSIAYMQLGQVEKALRTVGELVWLDPLNPDHYLKRAMLFHQQRNTRAAVAEYARVMEMAAQDSDAYQCAAESLESLDEEQLRQIVMLANDDRLFHWKLCRETAEAAQERGFFLSDEGIARLHQMAQSHLEEIERESAASQTWDRVRFYN
jgi:tetratricopeptide (TPR) repeat protein